MAKEKKKKLFVVILGEPKSGKSSTWEALFGRRIQKGKKILNLNKYLQTTIYIFVSSPQENYWTKERFLKEFKIADSKSNIVLCSLQTNLTGNMNRRNVVTKEDVLEIANKNGYDIFIQWLNPGCKSGEDIHTDVEHQIIRLTETASVIGMKKEDARNQKEIRAEKIRTIMLGWILSRN